MLGRKSIVMLRRKRIVMLRRKRSRSVLSDGVHPLRNNG
jgi:hypothetical protein